MSDCCDGNFFDKFIKPRLAVASGHRDLVDEILDEILFADETSIGCEQRSRRGKNNK